MATARNPPKLAPGGTVRKTGKMPGSKGDGMEKRVRASVSSPTQTALRDCPLLPSAMEILGVGGGFSPLVYDSLNSVHIYRFTVSSLAFFGRLTLFLLFRNF